MQENQPPGAPAEQYEQESTGYCIEIYVGPDNQVQSVGVSREPKQHDDSALQLGNTSIEQSLLLVRDIIEAGGELPTDGGMAQQDMADALEGYGRGGLRGVPVQNVLRDDR